MTLQPQRANAYGLISTEGTEDLRERAPVTGISRRRNCDVIKRVTSPLRVASSSARTETMLEYCISIDLDVRQLFALASATATRHESTRFAAVSSALVGVLSTPRHVSVRPHRVDMLDRCFRGVDAASELSAAPADVIRAK